ncbi:MAG: dihydrofolate reductase family protein [Polyangiaceae bacterium]|jgi:riboflavin biosynthesis pyrimidine reductase
MVTWPILSPDADLDPVAPGGRPFDVLFEFIAGAGLGIPAPLAEAYGADLILDPPRTIANFVASVDGVVALPIKSESGQIISRYSAADRFLVGLLRACSDAVVVGAGTLRKAPGDLWHADAIYPSAAVPFAQMRAQLGLFARPKLVVVTGSGIIDLTQPALRDAFIVTTAAGEARLREQRDAFVEVRDAMTAASGGERPVIICKSAKIRFEDVWARLRSEGMRTVLVEGGPLLFAELAAAGLVDELFLTLSPSFFGRFPHDGRKSLIDGLDVSVSELDLLSARRHGSHLFLRYAMTRSARPPP